MTDESEFLADSFLDVLAVAGASSTYRRGTTSTTMTMVCRYQPSRWSELNGVWTEIRPVDFLVLSSAFPHDEPKAGDQIVYGGETFTVLPTTSEKVYRKVTPSILRIHTKQTR